MIRIGQSIDYHNLIDGDKVMVGGVTISSKYGVEADSDGDVLMHAIAEAILGALNLGDLGEHFKPGKKENLLSIEILNFALKKLTQSRFKIVNIDTMLICEQIMIGKYKNEIRMNLRQILGITTEQINIKATRWEDPKNMQIAAQVVLLIEKTTI